MWIYLRDPWNLNLGTQCKNDLVIKLHLIFLNRWNRVRRDIPNWNLKNCFLNTTIFKVLSPEYVQNGYLYMARYDKLLHNICSQKFIVVVKVLGIRI